jgi:hypothetical protein
MLGPYTGELITYIVTARCATVNPIHKYETGFHVLQMPEFIGQVFDSNIDMKGVLTSFMNSRDLIG